MWNFRRAWDAVRPRVRRATRPFPILGDLPEDWADWKEAFKEVFIVAFFSLMPLWLGLLLVAVVTVSDGSDSFLSKFASSSDLGILSAALLGPSLYMMFREQSETAGLGVTPRFPSGLWFIITIIACCVVATAIYSLNYLSGIHAFFDRAGLSINFVNSRSVAVASWILFGVSITLVFLAAAIRNSIETRAPAIMSGETADYVEAFRAAQDQGPVDGDQQ